MNYLITMHLFLDVLNLICDHKLIPMRLRLLFKNLMLVLSMLTTIVASAQTSVLTQHNNNNRTGWYDNEIVLNKSNVHSGSFGRIFTRAVDDQIYAQPLVKLNLAIPNKGNKNVVIVATVNNSVYAFDADSANVTTPYWQINLTPAHSRAISRNDETGACGGFYRDFSGKMGIVGTPVIDSATNIMYVVVRSVDTSNGTKSFKQYLHAINIKTGANAKAPVLIAATVAGNGDGSVNGQVSFSALHNNQRGGLLLSDGVVYITWSSHCDWGPYHGWVIGYDKTTLQQTAVYNTTPDGYNGGIWMSGGGPSADSAGNIYLAVGNGSVGKNGDPSNLRNRSESALKLAPAGNAFTLKSYFTPKNYEKLEGADLDFGVTQIMLIPNTDRAIVGVKDGHIYLLDRNNMGGFNVSNDNIVQTIDLGSNAFLRSAMSYYKGKKEFAYSWSENSLLRAYPYNRTTKQFDLDSTVISGLQGPTGNNGAVLSVSSNASVDSTGILWASYAANGDANQSVRPGILRAIDASDVTKELWNSSVFPDDNPGNYAKFNCPTIANGKVYLPTFSNQLVVYGLIKNSSDSCSSANIALNKPAVASSFEGAGNEAAKAFDGSLQTRWASEQQIDPQYIYVDLGKRYDICQVALHWEVALAEDFKIQVSDDAANWIDAATITGNTSFDNYISLKASGRYVRMYGTKRGTTYGYSLYEFEVHGKPSASNCSTPTDLYTTNVYETSATLHWSGSNTSNYVVQYKTVTAVDWNQITTVNDTITLNDLSCNTPYQFRVQSVCSGNDSSSFSTPGGFTTLECDISCDPLPTRWSTQDIGDIGVAGSACYNSATGTFELKGSGDDIWDVQDEFRFAYKTIVSDGEIIARVLDQDNSNEWNKCGIMVRESLAEGSRHAFIALTSGNGAAMQYRPTTDGESFNDNTGSNIKAPYWIKMVISGTTYTGYISPDGLTWTKVGNTVDAGFGNGSPVYAGLAITSHDNAVLSTAHVDNYSLGGVLAVKLISFAASLTLNHTVNLEWTTTRESKTNYFIVERTKDFWNYSTVDTIYAENNGEFTQNYETTDLHPLSGISYYRLKIVDMDGKASYSPIAAVRVATTRAPLMYPNPANSYVNIAQGADAIKQITIYNVVGRTVLRIPNASSQSIIKIPTYALSAGLYFIEIRTAKAVYRDKLIKAN